MTLVITASQINQWAASKREAQDNLPILIRRLIAESLPKATIDRKDFPSDIGRHGFDGVLTTRYKHTYIPKGKSVWEVSVEAKIGPKATKDFNSRKQRAKGDTAFIFVTARKWQGKNEWVESKQNSTWSKVCAYDASDLEQWLESSPNTTLWLSEQIGLPQYHIQLPKAFLENWLNDTDPAFPRDLILQDRDEAKSKILDFVNQSYLNESLTILADTSDEALAFICATFDATPDSATPFKSLVITKEQGIDELMTWQGNFDQTHILVVRTSDLASKIPSELIGRNLLFVAEARGAVHFNPADERYQPLPRVRNFDALANLHEKTLVLKKRTGESLSALHRLLNRNPGKKNPHWAKLHEGNRKFIWLALIGGWDERHDADKKIIRELSKIESFVDWREFTAPLLKGEDAPLFRTREDKPQYKLFSRIDAFLAISQEITGGEIDRLFKKIQKIYFEDDPNYHSPDDERLHVYKKRKYSDALRRGIMDGLAILACYSERKALGCGDVTLKIKKFFDNVFADDHAWSKLRDLLPEFAEVDSRNFIKQLQGTLDNSPKKIVDLFTPRRDLVWGDNYLHPPLLWALERLAWNPDNLDSVLKILCRLQQDYEGKIRYNFMNRPSESMNNILRSWMPQTSANIGQRIEALCSAYSIYPYEVANLALGLVKWDGTGSLTNMPIWRDDVLAKPKVNQCDHTAMVEKSIDLIVDYLQNTNHLLANRVEIAYQAVNNFQWWGIKNSQKVADAICKISTNDDTYNRKLFDLTREWIKRCSLQSRRDHDIRKINDIYKKLHAFFEPRDLIQRYSYLFDASTRINFYQIDRLHKKFKNMANNAHCKALSDIYEKDGFTGLIALLKHVEAPDIVAVNLYVSYIAEGKFPDVDEYLITLLDANLEARVKRLHLFFLFYGAPPSKPMDASATIAVIKPVLKRVNDTTKKALLLQTIRIDQPEGRDFIDKQSSDVKRELFSYEWIQRGFYELRPRGKKKMIPRESTWLVDHYIRYKRPRLALASFIMPDYIPAKSQLDILSSVFISNRDVGTEDPVPKSYHIERMFESLAKQYSDVDSDTLAQLAVVEMKFHNFLSHSEYSKSGGFILRYLANSPTYFIDLNKYEQGNSFDMNISEVNTQVYAGAAFHALSNLNLRCSSHLPWVGKNNTLDTHKLRNWIREVRQVAKEEKMSRIIDKRIGVGLSHSRLSRDDPRPEYAVCDIMKNDGSLDMYEGFRIGRYNSRGVLTDDTDNMGFSSAELALAYSDAADKLRDNYPDMATVFDELFESYQKDAEDWQTTGERIDINFR